MKKYFLFLFLLPLSCLAQNFQWAKQIQGTAYQFGNAIALDAAGNIYVTGNCEDTTDFDPGAGVYNLITQGWYSDIFVAKYDPLGNLTWAKKMGGSDIDQSLSIAVDAAGNVYTTGSFFGTADFNPGAGVYTLTSPNNDDIFISKLDVNGNFVWAKQSGGAGSDVGYGIALDASGNIYTTGNFGGTSDFDPGAGTYNLVAPNSNIFTWKLDPAGNFIWAKQQGGNGAIEIGYAITIDNMNNIYTTGTFSDTADFDPGAGTFTLIQQGNAGTVDRYVSKLDVNGNFIRAYAMEGMGYSIGYSIAVDGSQNVYTTGTFAGSCDFDPGSNNFTLVSIGGFKDIFISKEDSSGNMQWAKRIGSGSNYDSGNDIAVDAFGNVYVTGFFDGTVDFDPGAGTFPMTSMLNAEDVFISILDNNGNFVNALAFNGYATDRGLGIVLDNTQNIFAAGAFNATVDFDPGSGVFNLNSAYGFDAYFVKLGALSNAVNEVSDNMDVRIYPSPADGIFTVQCNDVLSKVEICNMLGEIVLVSESKSASQQFDLSNQPAGVYFVTTQTGNNTETSKIIIR